MKSILITPRLEKIEDYGEIRECLDIQWGQLLGDLGLTPIVLPLKVDPLDYFGALAIRGLILTGGNDLYSANANPLSKMRDDFERDLLTHALDRGVPILGVCRGLQLIADNFGSKAVSVENHVGAHHPLVHVSQSKLHPSLARVEEVNSYHDFGIKTAPDSLTTIAQAEDGTIEALENPDLRIFAQMWHPERESPWRKEDCDLLEALFQ